MVVMPMSVGVSVVGLTKVGEPKTGGLHQNLKDNSVFLIKPLPNTKVYGTTLKGNNHALTHIYPQTSPSNYIDMVRTRVVTYLVVHVPHLILKVGHFTRKIILLQEKELFL